jgi:HKD family nuclease
MIKPLIYERELLTTINRELTSAKEFEIATALVSMLGVESLHRSIKQCLEKGGRGKILIGVDLPSDPNAIEKLRVLAIEYSGQFELKYFRPLKNRIFHPKLFLFRDGTGNTSAIIGSSNLTGGGLTENYEANIWVQSLGVANQFAEYFDEHFEGAYSSRVTPEWLADYRKEWSQRKKLFDRLRGLRRENQVRARRHAMKSDFPKCINGYRIAFTGGIHDWPRSSRLYPLVKRLGGKIVEAERISSADCLIHAEDMHGRKTTLKLRGARQRNIPILTEEDFWVLVGKEEALRKRK